MDSQQREIDVAEAMLKAGKCPFDGDHFSTLSRAACPVCNPPKDGIRKDNPRD